MEVSMFKKVFVPLILALVIALPFSATAFAANTMPGNMRAVGTILWVNQANGTFKFDTEGNVNYTIHVNTGTVYRDVTGLAGLRASDYANIEFKQLDTGEYEATHIFVYEPRQVQMFINGIVTSVGPYSFTLIGDNGISYVFQVNTRTTFSGYGVAHFRELTDGMAVRVDFRNLGPGNLSVTSVVLRHNPLLY
jgi:hypothetical protein